MTFDNIWNIFDEDDEINPLLVVMQLEPVGSSNWAYESADGLHRGITSIFDIAKMYTRVTRLGSDRLVERKRYYD